MKKENPIVTEVWKDIKGYEGFYQVSNLGRVKSLERVVIRKGGKKLPLKERILRLGTHRDGYLKIRLSKNGKGRIFFVHRLVCEAFHKNPKNKPEVNHINEDKTDNRACNLEWATREENVNHGTRNTRVAKTLGKPVGQYTRDGKLIKVWQSAHEVQRQLGFYRSMIIEASQGKLKTAYGYVWKYVDKGK